MKRFNLEVFKKFWDIAKLYWFSEEKKGAWTLLGFLIILLIANTVLSVSLNQQSGNLISALSAKSSEKFWQSIYLYLGILIVYVPLAAGYRYIRNRLGLYWRRWLTNRFTCKYLSDRSFYKIGNFNTEIDNPDQRIAEDINSFCLGSLGLFLTVVSSFSDVIGFSGQLWQISQQLVVFLLLYAIGITLVITGIFGRFLVKLNFEQLKKEANFRFGLIRIRENAESIAFYGGEAEENKQINRRFNQVYNNFNKLILWRDLLLGLFTNPLQFLPYIIPAVIVGSKVLSGELEVGKVSEATGAFLNIFFSLNIIVSQFEFLTAFTAGIDRLDSFAKYIEKPTEDETLNQPTIDVVEAKRLAIESLTLYTPNYQRTLIKDLSVELLSGQGLLIVGASGCGKSSILRAIAGLWNSGKGLIIRPQLEEMLFLPQRPYMILGTLREQLLYPYSDRKIDDREFYLALKQVNLPDIAERFGGLDIDKDWSEVLSLGEQQRVAFARILINRPRYAILDESTSALDVKNEESLYQHLLETETTFISVGHRPSLIKYHNLILEILDESNWRLKKVEDIYP